MKQVTVLRTEDNYEKKKSLAFEFAIVFCIAFLPFIMKAVFIFVTGINFYNYSAQTFGFLYSLSNVQKLSALLLLIFVLSRRGKKLSDLGLAFRAKDILRAIGIIILVYIVNYLYDFLCYFFTHTQIKPSNIEFLKSNITIWFVLFIVINPFFEEIMIRGFVIQQIKQLTNNIAVAVLISVLIQTTAHLYQGILPALGLSLTFLIFSLYYVKTNNLTPVVIAHLIMDLLILVRFLLALQ